MPRFIPSARSARFFADDHFLLGRYDYDISHMYSDKYSNDCERVLNEQLTVDSDGSLFVDHMEAKEDIMNSVRLAHKYKQVIALQANVRRCQEHMRLIRAYFGHVS